jgi:hypothetical protein
MEGKRKAVGYRKRWDVKRHDVNGASFEKWAAKTVISAFCALSNGSAWDLNGKEAMSPPDDIVRAIYGLAEFPEYAGLYINPVVGETQTHDERVTIDFRYAVGSRKCLGAFIQFKGVRFLIWFATQPPEQFGIIGGVLHRPNQMRFNQGKVLSQKIVFGWN